MEQYIADKKILGVVELDTKTPGGKEMVQVNFEDGTSEKTTKLRFELTVTGEKSDATKVDAVLKKHVGAMLFGLLHEYGVKWGEVNKMSDAMVELVDLGYAKASDVLWGYERVNIPLIDINNVLLKSHAETNSNGTASSGGGSDQSNKEQI